MSQYLPLSTKSVQFILTLFDAGATMHQILDAFYASGQMGVQYVTIQRCLQEHGRILPVNTTGQNANPSTGLNQVASTFHPQSQQPQTNQVGVNSNASRSQPSAGQIASVFNPILQVSTPTKANSAPIYNWNAQADIFALSAYRYGQTATQIAGQLHNNGYDHVTVEEVMASLIRQGVKNATW